MQEKALKKTSPDAAFAPPPGTKSSDPYKNPPSIMDTMAKTEKSDDKVDVFGSNQVTALGASILLAAALLFGTIYTGDGGDDSGRKRKVRKLLRTALPTKVSLPWGGGGCTTVQPQL